MSRRTRNKAKCGPGEVLIQRDAYTRSDGTHVAATEYCAEDQGAPGITSRGAKSGPYADEEPWITHEGKLGGPGYTKKPARTRHKILNKCVDEYGYRSCLGSLMVLTRSSEISAKVRKVINDDIAWLEKKYGGEGSFGPEENPARTRNRAKCAPGEIRIKKEGYHRKAYTRADGTRVAATDVPPSEFCIEDRGAPGVVSRGAKSGPHKGEPAWITHEGKLGGPGYTSKTQKERRKILDRCVKRDGYRSCLGSVMVLLRSSEISADVRKKLEKDKAYLKKTYGGPGSFGPRENPGDLQQIRQLKSKLLRR
jgi:hypothetical protein